MLLDRRRLTSDGLLIPLENGEEELLTRLAQTKIGVGVGYAHTFMLSKRIFLTPFAIIGPEFRFININKLNGTRTTGDIRVSPRFRTYLAFGWNGDRTAVALSSFYLPGRDVTESLETRFDTFTIELRITCRFLYPGHKKNKH